MGVSLFEGRLKPCWVGWVDKVRLERLHSRRVYCFSLHRQVYCFSLLEDRTA